jgi:PAS domain S-box-containing protein
MSTEIEPRANLLLVDDQAKNLLALEAILEPLGQNLVRAHSGHEALKQLLRMDFAAILLDVQMPEMDGFETATLIKQRARSRHIPILFLTAISKDDPYVFKGYSVGAVDYIFKPFNPDVLRSKVSVFIELFRKNEKIKQQAELLRVRREREVAEFKKASEQRYRDLAESMPQIVWTADANGTLTYRNRRFFDCAGIEYDPDTPVEWETLLHPDDRVAFRRQWRAAIDASSSLEAEFRFGSAATGAYRWHLVRAVAMRGGADATASATSWIGTSTDIDDRKRAEEALRLLAEASTVLAASLDCWSALDQVARLTVPTLGDWCIIDVRGDDAAPRRIAAVHVDPSSELASDPASVAATPAWDHEGVGAAAESVLATGKRRVVTDLAGVVDGADADLLRTMRGLGGRSFMCVPILARDGVIGTISFMTADSGRRYGAIDVSLAEDLARRVANAIENARLYDIAQRERAQLAEANRAKDEFLAVLSHELRTPLNSMLGWTQIVRAGGLDEKTLTRALETIERNAKSQAQLIADLLDVSRIVTGKLNVEPRPVMIASIVEGAVEAARPAAKARDVELAVAIELRNEEVHGDPDRLQQVVGNLLSNAIKFTPPSGRVSVRLARVDGTVRLDIEDSGQGIDPAFLPHVFERFRQGEGATTRVHGGLGLGLAIVRHLVEVHRGSVHASSEGLNKGAHFTVTLPLHHAGEKVNGVPAETVEGSATLAADALRGLNVLVVEDDDDGRELLEMVLNDYGAHVTAVASAGAALETLSRGGHDVLVSDIGLPMEDGYSLLRRVRELDAASGGKIPAIALTAYASGDDRARALAAGFEAHVTKPVEPQELAAAVASLVHARRASAEIARQSPTPRSAVRV